MSSSIFLFKKKNFQREKSKKKDPQKKRKKRGRKQTKGRRPSQQVGMRRERRGTNGACVVNNECPDAETCDLGGKNK
jgi:hypothetical protein